MQKRRNDPTLTLVAFDPAAVKMSDADKLTAIHARLTQALTNRSRRCKLHAAELVADMEVVGQRLSRDGFNADIGSVKVAAYHIAQTELEVLRRVMTMVESVLLQKPVEVDPPEEDDA